MKTSRSWRGISALVVFTVFIVTGTAFGYQKPNFSGNWKLVKEKSSNLPGIFQSVDEYLLVVNQTGDDSISFGTKFTGRGQTITTEADAYTINNTAIEKEDRRGVKTKRTLRFDQEKPRLLIETKKEFTGEVQLPNTHEDEVWELSDDGKTLTVTITPKTEGGQKQVRVFTKGE